MTQNIPTKTSDRLAEWLGPMLDGFRKKQQLSMRQLAEQVGTSLSQIQRILKGQNVSISTLLRVTEALGLEVEFEITKGEPMHPSTKALLQFFSYAHLPPHLQEVSGECFQLAHKMVAHCPDNQELTVGLRKLLEAKDCFVRACLEHKEEADGS